MTGLDKFWYSIRGWYSCTSWIIIEIVKEYLPDLVFWKPPTHPDDFNWYAELVNGRLAMLAVTIILVTELTTKSSIWNLVHVL
jgi:hypothetical protein